MHFDSNGFYLQGKETINRKYSLSSMDIKIALVLRKIQEIKIFDNEYTYDTSQIIRTLVVLCGDIHRRNHDKD